MVSTFKIFIQNYSSVEDSFDEYNMYRTIDTFATPRSINSSNPKSILMRDSQHSSLSKREGNSQDIIRDFKLSPI